MDFCVITLNYNYKHCYNNLTGFNFQNKNNKSYRTNYTMKNTQSRSLKHFQIFIKIERFQFFTNKKKQRTCSYELYYETELIFCVVLFQIVFL